MTDDPFAPRPSAPCRRPRDRRATERALLAAGARLFAERGYDAATTREVAAAAGVNEQLITRYFGGKAGLLKGILDGFGKTGCDSAGPPPAADVEGEIAGFLAFHLAQDWQAREVSRVTLERAVCDGGIAHALRGHVAECRARQLHDRLAALAARGLIDPAADLPRIAQAVASLSFALGVVDQVVLGTEGARIHPLITESARVLARGLAPPGAGPRPTADC